METSYRDRLVGGYRLLRVRNLKAWAHAALILAASVLVALSLLASGASMKPLYIPLEAFLPAVLVTALIGAFLEMFFRALEIRFSTREAQKFLMVTNAMSRISIVFIICGLLVAIVLFPPTHQMIAGSETTEPESLILPRDTTALPFRFETSDPLGGVRFTGLLVQVVSGRGVEVILERDELTLMPVTINNRALQEIPLDRNGVHAYVVTFLNPTPEPVTFSYALRRVVLPALFTSVPGFAIALMVVGAGFFFYLYPLRTKYQRSSIFSQEYSDVMNSGERLYSEYRGPAPTPIPGGASTEGVRGIPHVSASPVVTTTVRPDSSAAAPALLAAPAGPASSQSSEPVPEDLFAEGAHLFTRGDFDGAIARFDEILQMQPRAPIALAAKGNTLLKLGRATDALAVFEEALAVNPSDPGAFLGKVDALALGKRWRDVMDQIDTALVARPGDPALLERKGDALLALERREEAQIAFGAALSRKPGDPSLLEKLEQTKVDVATLQSRALIASASGNLDEALQILGEILRVEPENVNALVAKGTALRRAGRLDDALSDLEQALALKPDHGGALLARGRILEDRNFLDDALDTYDRLLELDPRDTDAWVAQGNVLLKMGRAEDALLSYQEALKISPDDEDLKARASALDSERVRHDHTLRELLLIKGIGPARAKALQEAGFKTVEDFRNATEDDLLRVHGLTRKVAADIVGHFRAQAKDDPS